MGLFGLWVGFAFVARVLGLVIAGVEPEAWVLAGFALCVIPVHGEDGCGATP